MTELRNGLNLVNFFDSMELITRIKEDHADAIAELMEKHSDELGEVNTDTKEAIIVGALAFSEDIEDGDSITEYFEDTNPLLDAYFFAVKQVLRHGYVQAYIMPSKCREQFIYSLAETLLGFIEDYTIYNFADDLELLFDNFRYYADFTGLEDEQILGIILIAYSGAVNFAKYIM